MRAAVRAAAAGEVAVAEAVVLDHRFPVVALVGGERAQHVQPHTTAGRRLGVGPRHPLRQAVHADRQRPPAGVRPARNPVLKRASSMPIGWKSRTPASMRSALAT